MKVTLDSGQVIDLAVTEATPSIGIVDYSRRVTDDYGVTTVVQRDFARRMSVRLLVPSSLADTLQRNLVRLRATAAQWTAVAGSPWLDFRGFYKEFEVDLATPTVSYCTLTVESLAGPEVYTETWEDPAPDGVSILQLLQPAVIGEASLIASNLPENDYPEWSAATTYGLGARVIKAATHRIYESAAVDNAGNDPAGISGKWRDLGPTNRWAMFDQALGSVATADGEISVTLAAGEINAVAVLDTTAAAVRVQAAGYDRTVAPNESGTATLLDLPLAAGNVTITITGPGMIEAGTLLIGRLVGLGHTEEGPKAGINDYSVKETDDFGEVKVVERAWAKRMSVRSKIRTDALDIVASRIAAVRARPSLWIGKDGLDTLTIYGFFRDFTIERDITISTLALTVEGLSTAGKVEPMAAVVDWPDVKDPFGTKPEDNATVGAPAGTPVAGLPAEQVVATLDQLDLDVLAAKSAITRILDDGAEMRSDLEDAQAAIIANGEGIQAAQQTLGDQGTSIMQLQAIAENIEGDLAQLSTTVTAQGSTVSQLLLASETHEGQIGQLEQSLFTTNANVSSLQSAYSTLDEGLAQVEQTLTTQGASISINAQAITTLEDSVSQLSTTIFSGSEPNLLASGNFDVPNTGWFAPGFVWGVKDPNWQSFIAVYSNGPNDNKYANTASQAAQPGQTYSISCEVDRPATGPGGACFVGARIIWTQNGNTHSVGPWAVALGASNFGVQNRLHDSRACPAECNGMYAQLVVEGPGTAAGSYYFRRVKINRGTSYAWSDEASITESFTSLNGLFARWSVELDVNGYVSGIALNNNGARSDFILRSDRFQMVTPAGGTRTFEIRQGTIIGYYPNGSKMYQLGDQAVA